MDAGFVYAADGTNNRVVKYDEDGDFVLMFGGEVNKEPGAAEPNVCTAADVAGGDECGAGVAGSAAGFFDNQTVGTFIAVGPTGTIFVGDKGRIQEFNPDGTFKSQIPFAGDLSSLAGSSVFSLAIDKASGDLYFTTGDASIYRITPAGVLKEKVEDTITVEGQPKTFPVNARSLTVDGSGNLYALDRPAFPGITGPYEVLKFDPSGNCLFCGERVGQKNPSANLILHGLATSSACGIPGVDLYVTGFQATSPQLSYVQSYGPAPLDVENCPPAEIPPEITDQFAVSVGDDEAEVRAQINPNFWKDTTYYVQYGQQECLDSGWTTGCLTEPAPPGAILTAQVLNRPVPTDDVLLDGLEPDTTYHYRFVAQSSGGGPAFGAAASFRTFPETLAPQTGCPNQKFREDEDEELSAFLPECRAYEMVSPVDKNGGDILTQDSIRDYTVELNVSSLGGEEITYSSEASFADSVSAPYSSQYIARRDSAGWQTEAISPPREILFRPAGKAPLFELDNQYKLFSPDLSQAWLMQEADPPLDDCGVEGFINWYRRDNATGAYEAVTTKLPQTKEVLDYLPEVQGVAEDGQGRTHTIYRANDQLATDSGVVPAPIPGYQLYEHVSDPGGGCGATRLVSVLPGETASAQESTAGTAPPGMAGYTFIEGRENLVHNAVSEDGSAIYWTAAGEGAAKIHVRFNGTETFEVSSGAGRFWFASDDGSVAYFTEGETLRRFTLSNQSATTFATQTLGLVAVSEDGEHAYFVSKADLDGTGEAAAGQPNLYLLEEGATTTFVATLSENDVSGKFRLNPLTIFPVSRTASLSENGEFLAFTSDAALTGQENTDAESGLADTQAFLYDAETGELRCVSCNPTGARPSGRVIEGVGGAQRGYAARVPVWKNQFHAPRVISADGSRVFFESVEQLVPRDGNGKQDVYAWMRGESSAECQTLGAELFNADAGGCISLISSGTGEGDASFVDSTPDGSDVFFKTLTSLVASDPGRVDLYDARVGGGFSPPPTPICEAKPASCKGGPPPDPSITDPGSTTGGGGFNPAKCKPLQRKAKGFAAKARKLRKEAAKAQGAQAKALGKQAKKQTKKANRARARAQSCLTGARGK
ncbi:MAG TPA: hypothetical protein VF255_11260 [Solirubrobacterales bacterium]